MGHIVRFPGDLITEHDRRRLTSAADGTPFDLEFRKNDQGVEVPLADMMMAARGRTAGDLFHALFTPAAQP